MTAGKVALLIIGVPIALFVVLGIIGTVAPEKPKPELLAAPAVGCSRQEVAVALARSLSTPGTDKSGLSRWSEQNGCGLTPAGSYITAIEEEAGHAKVTKVTINGAERYLLGIPRPTSGERLNSSVADLKSAVADLKKAVNGDR